MELDEQAIRAWIQRNIPSTFEGEDAALAKYILALLRKAPPRAEHGKDDAKLAVENARKRCLEQLEAFLHSETEPFVTKLFDTLRTKSYNHSPSPTSVETSANSKPKSADSSAAGIAGTSKKEETITSAAAGDVSSQGRRPRILAPEGADKGEEVLDSDDPLARPLMVPKQRNGTRTARTGVKRAHNDGTAEEGQNGEHIAANGATASLLERGKKVARVEFTTATARQHLSQRAKGGAGRGTTSLPARGSGLSERFAQLEEQKRMMAPSPNKLGGSGIVMKSTPATQPSLLVDARGRCRSYELLGFCLRGDRCPYSHGSHPLVVMKALPAPILQQQHPRQQYNPEAPGLFTPPATLPAPGNPPFLPPMRGVKRPAVEKTNSLLVRRLPAEKNSISQLNEFFGQFGELKNIQVAFAGQRDTALVTYETVEAASRAYRSQQPIFNNRFIFLQWHRGSTAAGGDFPQQGQQLSIATTPPGQFPAVIRGKEFVPTANVAKPMEGGSGFDSSMPLSPAIIAKPRSPPPSVRARIYGAPGDAPATATLLSLKVSLYLKNSEKMRLLLTKMKALKEPAQRDGEKSSDGEEGAPSPDPTAEEEETRKKRQVLQVLARQIHELSREMKKLKEEIDQLRSQGELEGHGGGGEIRSQRHQSHTSHQRQSKPQQTGFSGEVGGGNSGDET